MTLTTRQLRPDQLTNLQRFYKYAHYKGRVSCKDDNWVLCDKQGTIFAAARLTQQANERILRGVWVQPAYRHQGLGRLLLRQLAEQDVLACCYTFPYTHLSAFYRQMGFITIDQPPAHLLPLLRRYNRQVVSVLLMRYEGFDD